MLALWNPDKELKAEGFEVALQTKDMVWNPDKELKDQDGLAIPHADEVWNPDKELKAHYNGSWKAVVGPAWNPDKELKAQGYTFL